jgi:ribosomal protein L37AE/L43A
MKRDGYKNKYTDPRRAEATKDKYQVEIQTIKLTRNKHPKRLQVSKTQQETSENSDIVTCDKCGKTFKKRGLKLHTTLKHATVSKNAE